MKQLYTIPIQIEGISQQDAEQKINKVMDIAAGYKPTIWDFLCVLGVAYLQGRAQEHEREKAKNNEIANSKASKTERRKRASGTRKSSVKKKNINEKPVTEVG